MLTTPMKGERGQCAAEQCLGLPGAHNSHDAVVKCMLGRAERAAAVPPRPSYDPVQEWSPLAAEVEGQMHADLAALRAGIFESMPRLADRLTDAQHLLEVLGGIAAKTSAATPSFAAVLECMLAALQTLHPGSAQVQNFIGIAHCELAQNTCLGSQTSWITSISWQAADCPLIPQSFERHRWEPANAEDTHRTSILH